MIDATVTPTIDINTSNILGQPHKVLLFNDSVHSMDEVSVQIIKAINCTPERAVAIMYEAHSKGTTIVFTGSKERCEHVESILAGPPTRLITSIESV